jgi:hypothetical protein
MIDNVADDDAEVLKLESETSSWICQQREESGVRIGSLERGEEGVSLTGGSQKGVCFRCWQSPMEVNMSLHSGRQSRYASSPSLLIEHARSITQDWLATMI